MGDDDYSFDPGGSWSNDDTGAEGSVLPNAGYSGPTADQLARMYAPSSTYSPTANFNDPSFQTMSGWGSGGSLGAPSSGGGGGGARPAGVAGMQPNLISMGTPERTAYDHYQSLLANPEGMASDPAYKFLFNQGMQAFNRTAAAKGMALSGNTLAGAESFGQGTASNYMNQMLPQYAAGANAELQRFMGPAGLLPQYAGANNSAINNAGAQAGANALIPAYQQMLAGGGGAGYTPPGTMPFSGAGFGGASNPAYRAPSTGFQTLNSSNWNTGYGGSTAANDIPSLMDQAAA